MAKDNAGARAQRETVWVDLLLQGLGPTRYAILIVTLCVAAGMAEGYDISVMSLAAPMVTSAWSLSATDTGLLLSASILGMVIGSFLLSPLGDKWGRRPSILLSFVCVGIATVAGGVATDFSTLLSSRLVAGLGLGLALPNVMALAMELMPARLRSLTVVLIGCGIPMGTTAGSLASASLIEAYGYQAIFFVAGFATLAIAAVALPVLPESPLFLARKPSNARKLSKLLERLGAPVPDRPVTYAIKAEPLPRSPVTALFEDGRRTATILLWVLNLANMSLAYYLFTWLPTIIAAKGVTAQFTLQAMSIFAAGGLVGGLIMGLFLSRVGPTAVLLAAYGTAIATTLGLSMLGDVDALYLTMLAVCGAVSGGSQFCVYAVVNQFYPSAMRATASGYANGMGRLAGLAVPAIGAAVLSTPGIAHLALVVAAVPAFIGLIAISLLQLMTGYAKPMEAAVHPGSPAETAGCARA